MLKLTDDISILKNNYDDFEQVRFVFDSMIERTTIAEAFIDDFVQQSSISLVWDKGHCFYVGGTAKSVSDYLRAGKFLAEKFQNERIQVAKVYFNSDEWDFALKDAFSSFSPKIFNRLLFKHDCISNPSTSIAPNILISAIDKSIIESKQLKNIQQMKDEILGMWGTTERFLEKGFGYCAIADECVVSWCTSEYVSKKSCGIGIETMAEFQNKGIATKNLYYIINKCRELNIIPYWDCWSNNVPSIKVAEKQGFNKVLDYKVLFISKK
jgi:hypothetical protein